MGHMRTDSKQRYHLASLICDYLLKKNITHADVTARDIAKFHHLSGKTSQSISAMLNFLHSNRIRETRLLCKKFSIALIDWEVLPNR